MMRFSPNKAKVYEYLKINRKITRSKLIEDTCIPKNTVIDIVDKLEGSGIIESYKAATGKGQRKVVVVFLTEVQYQITKAGAAGPRKRTSVIAMNAQKKRLEEGYCPKTASLLQRRWR